VRAARAAGRDSAADDVWRFLRETGGRDARLAAGGAASAPFLPGPTAARERPSTNGSAS